MKEVEQRIDQLLTLRVEVAHIVLLASVEEVQVDHMLYRVTAMAEILWTVNHTAKILEQVVDMYSSQGRGR